MQKIWKTWQTHLKQKPAFIIGGLFVLATFFRLMFWGNFPAGFDQIQILQNGHQIVQGDISLIGPRTGPANMFTGPLIYYLAVPFLYLGGDFFSVAVLPLFIALVSGAIFYWLHRKYLGPKSIWFALILWALSPFLVSLDRILWNPNLIFLASSLLFFPLLKTKEKMTPYLLFAGAFLAYQAHFSGFMLVGLSVVGVVFLHRPLLWIFTTIAGLAASLLPTLVFDLRNDWLNGRGLLSLLSGQNEMGIGRIIPDLWHNFYILAETTGKLFLLGNSTTTIVVLGFFLFIVAGVWGRNKPLTQLTFLWIGATSLAYAFYSGEKPEYYFLLMVPPIIAMIGQLWAELPARYGILLLALFALNAGWMNWQLIQKESGTTAGTIQQIKKDLQARNVKTIIYDMPYGADLGLRYFLADIPLQEAGEIIHIAYPHDLKISGLQQINGVGIWADQRTENKNYVTTNSYTLVTNPDYQLLQNVYHQTGTQPFNVYAVLENKQVIGTLSVAEIDKDQLEWVKSCRAQNEISNFEWTSTEPQTLLRSSLRHCLQLQGEVTEATIFSQLGLEIF